MKNKLYPDFRPRRRWLQLSVSLTLAFVFTFLILLLPGLTTAASSDRPGEVSLLSPLDAPALQPTPNLSITKVANPSNFVNQGNQITYTLIVTNNTPDNLKFLVVSDPIPANTSCDQIFDTIDLGGAGDWLGNPVACTNGTATWVYNNVNNSNSGGNFTPGEAVQLVYRVAVTQPFPDQNAIINQPTYQAASNNPDYVVTGTQQVSTTVNAPNWVISKSVVPTPTVQPGNRLTYTLVVTNNGHLATSGSYTVSEDLPSFTNFITATPFPASSSGQPLTWNFNTPLAIDQAFSITLVLSVTQPLTGGTSIVNQSYSVAGGNVFSPGLGAPVTVTVQAPISLTIDKTDDPYDPVQAGDLLTYTVTITNNSSSTGPAQGLIFTDTLPTNTVLQNAGFVTPTTGMTSSSGSIITWTVSSPAFLPIGSAVQLALTVRVQSPLPTGTLITNDRYGAAASNPSTVTPPVPITTTVHSAPQITLTKTVTPQIVVRGQQVTYTIVVTNSGNETAVNIPLTDTIQASDFSPNSANWTITTVTGTDLAGNPGVVTRTLVATAGTTAGQFPNFVTTTVTSPITIGPVATVTVRAPVDFAIRKDRVGTGTVVTGDPVTYTLTITNVAGSDTADAVISDTFVNADAGVLTYTVSYSGATCNIGSNPVICNVPALTGTTVITLVLDSSNSISGVITNTAFITPALAGLGDPITSNNRSAIITTPVRYPLVDLQIDKARLGSSTLIAGDRITYTITVTNAAGSDIVDAVVTDTFDTNEASFVGCLPVGCVNPGISGVVTWTLRAFTGTQQLTMTLDSLVSFSGTLTNSIEITPTTPFAIEQNGLDNSDTQTDTVRYPLADLQIDKARLGSSTLIAGDRITYTITVTNAAGSDIVDAVVTDTFDTNEASFVGCLPAGCANPGSGVVTWTLRAFTGTQQLTLTLDSLVSFSGTLTNSIEITPTTPFAIEQNRLDNSDTQTDTVRYPLVDLQIDKARLGGGGTLIAGDRITYTITVTNAAGSDIVDAVVTDTFDTAEASFVGCLPVGCVNPGISGVVTWTLRAFTGTQQLTLTLDSLVSFSGTLTNSIEITPTTPFAIEQNGPDNSDTQADPIRYPLADLQIDKARLGSSTLIAGDRITYTITVTNAAGSDIVDAVVTDTFDTAEASFVGCLPVGCVNPGISGVVTWTLRAFTGTQQLTLTLDSLVSFSGTLTNSIEITPTTPFAIEQNGQDNTDTQTDTVRQLEANLSIQKLGPMMVVSDDAITYSIVITNSGLDPVDVIVTDTFGLNGTFVSVTPAGSCSGIGPVVCNFNAFSGVATITLVLDTKPTKVGLMVTNTAVITTPAPNAIEQNPGDESSSVNTLIIPRQANLQIDKSRVGSGPVTPGDRITFTLAITNAGPHDVGATLGDSVVPASSVTGIEIFAPASWSCSGQSSASVTCNTTGSFTANTTDTVTVVVTTSATFSGTLTNNSNIQVASTASEVDSSDNFSGVPVNVFPQGTPALTITKSASPGSGSDVQLGDAITYTLRITNIGTALAANVVVTDTLPGGVAFVASSGSSSGSFSESSGQVTINAATLGTGQALTATWQVTVTANTSGTLLNNQATANSASTSLISSNLTSHRVITTAVPSSGPIFLPIIFKNCCLPNLVITDFQVDPAFNPPRITVVIANNGQAPTESGFWVDLYLNPSTDPANLTGGDRRWQSVSNRGIAWPISTPLAAGDSRTLVSTAGFVPTQTNWIALTPGTYTFVSFVDSFDVDGDPWVEIFESNEGDNQAKQTNVSVSGVLEQLVIEPETASSPPAEPRRDLSR